MYLKKDIEFIIKNIYIYFTDPLLEISKIF